MCVERRGGTTCCVPQCKSNSMKNPDISFYQFPPESSVKETWLNLLGIKKQPLKSHKVCSPHFPGGKKTLNSLQTMPMSSCRQTKNSCEDRNSPSPKLKNCTSVQPTEENLQMNEVQSLYDSVTNEHTELQKSIMSCELNTISAYFELNMSLQVMQTLNFTQVFQTMQHLKYFLTTCNLLVIFLCTLVQRTQSIHQKCTTSVGDQGHYHQTT